MALLAAASICRENARLATRTPCQALRASFQRPKAVLLRKAMKIASAAPSAPIGANGTSSQEAPVTAKAAGTATAQAAAQATGPAVYRRT